MSAHGSPNTVKFHVSPGGALQGKLRVPGDKSISHRSIMLGSLAAGVSEVSGFLEGADALATLAAFRAMGVEIEGPEQGRLRIHGVGLHGLQAPAAPLDLGNSGTSMRLLCGLLAGQTFDVELVGDQSLSRRPMQRVTGPLASMGARIEATDAGTAPLRIHGNPNLQSLAYRMPVASAQVKSAILLAGLYARGQTCVTEPAPTRDHTERMLRGFGYPIDVSGETACLEGGGCLQPTHVEVPADISSAAFFLVGASIAEGSDIVLEHVGINPTRTGIIDILRLMGASIELSNQREVGGEPVADIRVVSQPLQGIEVPPELVPLAIDEFPAIFIAAACAEGETVVTGAEELRVKESDRISTMADGLVALGIDARPQPDGIRIRGGQLTGGRINSHGDHRIAMAFAMAALRANGAITIDDCANVNTSFPGFVELAQTAGLQVAAEAAEE
ncbi:3-phosphoshikimate 1-carboxyvinyltransferase [Alkalilimnicola ehrlichii]|uniref:3-phosphoshikimate 1-carboxyvinyltransferase n=1 Tax=Alkalilimnicola ehrlichii TaxID=351052 RepID=UPI002161DD49|nr:3-phosphoshikimate 1-carboxyvinyltransferase [Alkalilimnicola ehrlichii]